jgi:hypothetical protein
MTTLHTPIEAPAPAPRASRIRLHRPGRLGAVLLLLLVVSVPSIPLFLFGASSMATGVLLVCLLVTALAVWLHAQRPVHLAKLSRSILVPWLAVGLHFCIAAVLMPVDIQRFGASWALLLVFLAGACALAALLFNTSARRLDRALRIVLVAMLLIAGAGLAGFGPPAALPYEKPVFPFTEPSHFALSFLPFLLYFAIGARGLQQLIWIALGVALALQLENMTLLAGTVLVALVCNPRTALVVLPLATLAAAPFIDFYYFAARLDFSPESDNLSSLVFAQGWQLIGESLLRSSLWGIGFQQLGVRGSDVQFADLIYVMMDAYVNLSDGGFTLSKLLSEFGLAGMGLAAAHAFAAWRAVVLLQQHARNLQPLPVSQRLACAVVVAFTIELLIRGAGYFTASSLLYVASLFHLLQTNGLSTRQVRTVPGVTRGRQRRRRRQSATVSTTPSAP